MTESTEASKTIASAVLAKTDDGPGRDPTSYDTSSTTDSIDLHNELIDTSKIDDVLTRKMALVNAAIDEIGMTPFQWKLFFLNGYGYAVDSVSSTTRSKNLPKGKSVLLLLSVQHVASCLLPVYRPNSRDPAMGQPYGEHPGCCPRFTGWAACWCCCLGVFSRYHRTQACLQY